MSDEQVAVSFTPAEPPVDNGLVTAAVTVPAVKTAMPDGWSLHKVAALVRDYVMEMYDLPTTIAKHGLTPEQFEVLKNNEFFKTTCAQYATEWHAAGNTQRRLALESAIAVEDALPTVAARLTKSNEPLSDVVALLKVLSEIAGTIGTKAQQQQGTGQKFNIVINLGADTVVKHDVQITEQGGSSPPIQSLLEASGMCPAVPSNS